jgi:hypothetical protein
MPCSRSGPVRETGAFIVAAGAAVSVRYAVKDPDIDISAFLGSVRDMALEDTTVGQNQRVQEENGGVQYRSEHPIRIRRQESRE